MSKITVTTIAGATSGSDANKVKIESGDTLEVTSNATVGGDLTVDTNTLKVDSSNNRVGIGMASPSYQLDLNGGATTSDRVRLNRGTDDTHQFMTLGWDNISAHRANVGIASTQTNMNFKQVGSDGNRTVMQISSGGFVLKPLQPVFHVRRVSNQATSNNTNTSTPLEFPTSNAVVSSTHFNHTTHRFTAPVTGKYIFEWGYGTNVAAASVYRTFIWKNGARLPETQLRNDSNGHTGYVYASRSAILSLSVNDYVHLNCSTDSGTAFYGDNELSIFFQGQLIG